MSQRRKLGGGTIRQADHLKFEIRGKEEAHLSQVIHGDVLSTVPDKKSTAAEGLFLDPLLGGIGQDLGRLKRTTANEIHITVTE